MEAGKLRDRVEVQEDRGDQNDFGEVVQSWRTCTRRWAEVTTIGGDDRLVKDQYRQAATHRVRLRFMDSLTVRHRLRFDGRNLHILAIDDVGGRTREHLLTCEERLGD